MGPCEMFPQTLSHNPNGRYVHCTGAFLFFRFPLVQQRIINVLVLLFELVQIMYTPVYSAVFFIFIFISIYFIIFFY